MVQTLLLLVLDQRRVVRLALFELFAVVRLLQTLQLVEDFLFSHIDTFLDLDDLHLDFLFLLPLAAELAVLLLDFQG